MGSIRVGFFEDFKGAHTLLIDVDAEGLHGLLAWLGNLMSAGGKVSLSACPGARLQPGLRVELFRSQDDAGLSRTDTTTFVWRRSDDGWMHIVELLAAMKTGACHQYLDGPRDEVRVMASIGEYGDGWWSSLNAT